LIGRIKFGSRELPWYVQLGITVALVFVVIFSLSKMIASNFEEFVVAYPAYHDKILNLSRELSASVQLPVSVDEMIDKLNLPELFSNALDSSVSLMSETTLILIYVLFMLAEERIFRGKIEQIFGRRQQMYKFLTTVNQMDKSIRAYITVKTLLCLLSAVASYIVLYAIGVDFAFLWAFLIFFLNYIPIIGAFIGPLFPALIAFVQFDGATNAIIVLVSLAAIQLIIGNVIEPKALGDRLNLSPLVVIISLAFWGTLWGIAGMFLCVPITVMLMIVLSQFEKTRSVAILLSGGKVLK
jgi:predicted PurR-regulated permease PerM